MGREAIGEEVRALLAEHIESYEQLEVLVHLCRQGERGATLDSIASALRLPIEALRPAIDALQRAALVGFQEGLGGYRCIAEGAEGRALESFVRDYDELLVEVTQAMDAHALQRVRAETLRRFADTFIVARRKKVVTNGHV